MAESKRNIVIVGGGIIGCTSAYFLTRHPAYDPSKHNITLLEATKIAGGASGKAGGLLALWAYPSSLVPLSYKLHKQLADEHDGEERWGYRAVHCGQIDLRGQHLKQPSKSSVKGKDNEMDGENGDVGGESVSLQKRSKEALGKLRAAGMPDDLDWVMPETNPSYDEMGDPSTTAQVHPYQFTTSMADLAKEKGVDIRVGAAVKSINYAADGEGVESLTYEDKNTGKTETIPASDIIVSAGPWTQNIYSDAPISALRAHSVTIRPSQPISAYALFTQIRLPAGFGRSDAQKKARSRWGEQIVSPEIYARPKNEVYACGEGDHMVPLPASSDLVEVDESRCQDIVDHVSSVSNELRDGEVTARQACYLPNVNEGAGSPLVGHTGVKGLYLAAGHTCWGIQNGPGTGKLISEFVFDGEAKSSKARDLDPRLVL
ncbi:putative FAD dependent oxidoreductase [Polychaeton citri CBS 116435]|uniref:FAD dependent oxidoreductase n=1 Tax=Polychaeton citri CBS 116435 TaxID=1314669 RepID=A0A9P4Q9W1_9PEZI|nr:putative FAD dependent oxidoreductase [Polychaeton citri CBS 116435]